MLFVRTGPDAFRSDFERSLLLDDDAPRVNTRSSAPSTAMTVIIGVASVATAIFAAGNGAPGFFVAAVLLSGTVFVIWSLIAKSWEEQRIAEAERAAEEARERFKEEIAQSVKESMKGTVKVRCKYCGMLSPEDEDKCESCGAPL
jgi:hypothetical protein